MTIAAGVEKLRLKFPGASSLTFRDLTFSVRSGERLLLLGPSGCGKSTLLQVLTGLIPHAVDVPVAADSIVVPERWAYVFQDPDTQFCMPFVDEELAFVLENRFVPRDEMKERIERLLDRVGLKLADPHTPIAALSQGMKQRLAIAGALALEPDVLFLDEPTALLDPEGAEQVWDTIRSVDEGLTVVIVEHRIEPIVDYVDRVVLFGKNGDIVADGPPGEMFTRHRHRLAEDGIWYPGVWDDWARGRQPTDVRAVPGMVETRSSASIDGKALIELDGFSVSRRKTELLRVEQTTVGTGEWIAVVGPNGAGKSTLLLGLMRLLATGGTYMLHGRPAEQYRELSAEIAFVFQNPEFQFVSNSVYDEAAFSLRQEKRPEAEVQARTMELLESFDLTERRENHPFQLSLGQKRRLSVASAIVKEQRILLLDEPTFGQDARNTFALLERLEQWRSRGTAIVMVTHDPELVQRFATRVWVIENGRLTRDESAAEWAASETALWEDRRSGGEEAWPEGGSPKRGPAPPTPTSVESAGEARLRRDQERVQESKVVSVSETGMSSASSEPLGSQRQPPEASSFVSYRETGMHRVNPSLKLFVALVLFFCVLFTHNPSVMLNGVLVAFAILFAGSGHPSKRLALYVLPALLLFVSSSTSMMFYGKGETLWWEWGIIRVTEESFFRGMQVGLKSLGFAMIGLIFALTTRPVYLFYSLMQQGKVPSRYAYSFMAALRLLPIMLEEFQTLRHALAVRGVGRERGIGGLIRRMKAYAVPMLAQSIRRAQRIAVAMEAKRFTGRGPRTYYYAIGFSLADAAFIAGAIAACAAAYAIGVAVPYFDVTDVR
ncbi:ATP-binding cassette domain-containing protein [Paenibacillus hodogayensis]|uniref:ATP-binding cassette domain-containing protein n=1 Tax=Paenibacillus hodogayensis TaxID=279208 RepID=A0ABV5VT43_9BACL